MSRREGDDSIPRPLRSWAQWMRAGDLTPKTIETRIKGIRSLLTHAGKTDPLSLTPIDIIDWLADQESRWTRVTYAKTARAWHRWLVEQALREDDPTARLPDIKQPRGVPRPAASRAIDAALEVANRRARAYILLAAYEGLRVSEVAKVRGEHFDGDWLYVLGKGGVERWVPVHPMVAKLRRGWPARGYWFTGHTDLGHVRPDSVSQAISRTFRRAGHPVTAHQLRHWFGTHAQRVGKDVRVTQELLGHASLQSTQMYTEASDLRKADTVRRLSFATPTIVVVSAPRIEPDSV